MFLINSLKTYLNKIGIDIVRTFWSYYIILVLRKKFFSYSIKNKYMTIVHYTVRALIDDEYILKITV